ncbi:MAG: DUF2726 domain-containing protein [Lachnospiraceae bacterium]|nr:DUF2726 domain-containing protein [Lachnospiraceae bacterium]
MEIQIAIAVIIGIAIGAVVSSIGRKKKRRKNHYEYSGYKNIWEEKSVQQHTKEPEPDYRAFSSSKAWEKEEKQPKDDFRWKDIKVVKRKWAFDSKTEQEMYNFLRSELGASVRIDFHIHLNEIFQVEESEEESYFNKLWVCHVDFIVRNRKNPANVYFAVELDGHESHKTNERTKVNDEFKNRVFRENKIPLLHLRGDVNPYFKAFKEDTYPPELVMALQYTKDSVKKECRG